MKTRHGLLAAWALAAPSVQAQTETLQPVLVWGQSDSSTSDRGRLSTAWDAQAPLRELPLSATVIDSERLRTLRPDRLEDLTGLVPGMGVDVSSAGLSSAVTLRGFSLTRMHYDGVPDIQRLFTRDLVTVERIEVLAGPSAVLFGVTSPGGVVNYVGKQPQFAARHEWGLTIGSNALLRTTLDSTGPIGETGTASAWAYRVVAAAQDGHTAVARLPTRRQQGLAAVTWAYGRQPAEEGRLTLDLQQQRNQTPYLFGTVITNGGDPTQGVQAAQVQYDRLYVLPGGAPAKRGYDSGGLRWEQALGDGSKLTAQYRQAVVTRDETLLGFWTVETPTELSGYYTQYQDRYRQHNLRLQAEASAATGALLHRAVLGYAENRAGFVFSGVQNIGGFALNVAEPDFGAVNTSLLPTTARYNNEKQHDTAWWLADRVSFGGVADAVELTHLTLGVRHLRYAIEGDRNGAGRVVVARESGTSGHVGLSTALWPGLRGHAALNTGLEPSRGKTRSGEFLPAQRSRQWEAGVHWQLAPQSSARTAIYRVDLVNLRMTDPLDRTASISAGHRRVNGVETALDMAADGWSLNFNASASRTRHVVKTADSLGDEFVGVPRLTGGTQLSRDLAGPAGVPLRRWAAVTAVGPRFADAQNTARVAGYARTDLGGECVLAQGRQRLSAGLRNLANRRYVGALTALDDVYQGSLRQLWVSLAVTL